ncbi:hypothetical protein A2480_04580 [Candidatus Uhrbacteria bacterium RIFOXYC2_FULL_47_19]|uniref:Uncharacterized protein n=1 Tax=Candidatus Uhrbacteria bacterium RIFOXYC2_FULL_47_19 TaxID=1802424 RepID=A0A1F7WCT6_9BACT|nr:MAG: hypothetical protein A2480_04580 [Candidatus Uhrbacteria bacterium RIFOXYC2_FULL_47_19]
MITAKQNQKFPFHFFFRFAAEGGEETREKCKEIFWFLHTRVRERVRGALVRITTQSECTRQFQVTTRSARAISRHQGCFQNTFELCLIHTAKKKIPAPCGAGTFFWRCLLDKVRNYFEQNPND